MIMENNIKRIYLAGGCFWGVEKYFEEVPDVLSTCVGYANGMIENPTYEEVCSGKYDFAECVRIDYDINKIKLEDILYLYFNIIDASLVNRQGNDVGIQYRTGIYYIDEKDKNIIYRLLEKLQYEYDSPIVIEVKKIDNFYKAEEYHQKYLDKNPNGYCHISKSKMKYAKEYVNKKIKNKK